MSELYDVVAVNLETKAERIIATEKTERNAEAIVDMAAIRRGVEGEYFVKRPSKTQKDKTR